MSEQDWFTKDFYRELGVDKTADDATIKKAYRKLARKYHPDQNQGDAAAEAKFKDISEAYTVLSDKQQRQKYDAIRQMAGGGARFAPGGGAGFDDLFGGMFGGGSFGGRGGAHFSGGGVEDLLGGLFGGMGGSGVRFSTGPGGPNMGGPGMGGFPGGGYAPAPDPVRGQNLKSTVTLSFRQALKGTEIRLKVNGKNVNARIPAGVKDGQKIKLAGKGKPGSHGGAPGDLVISVTVKPHAVYSRTGNDLSVLVPVSVFEALNGATVEVPLLDGSTVSVDVPAGARNGQIIRVPGRGVVTSKHKGDLLVELQISLPAELSEEARTALDAFAKATKDFDPRAALADLVGQA